MGANQIKCWKFLNARENVNEDVWTSSRTDTYQKLMNCGTWTRPMGLNQLITHTPEAAKIFYFDRHFDRVIAKFPSLETALRIEKQINGRNSCGDASNNINRSETVLLTCRYMWRHARYLRHPI